MKDEYLNGRSRHGHPGHGYEMINPEQGASGVFLRPQLPTCSPIWSFERMLSASGPNAGEVKRPSDEKHPKKVAWDTVCRLPRRSEGNAALQLDLLHGFDQRGGYRKRA